MLERYSSNCVDNRRRVDSGGSAEEGDAPNNFSQTKRFRRDAIIPARINVSVFYLHKLLIFKCK